MQTIIPAQETLTAGSMKAYLAFFTGENDSEPRDRILVFATTPEAALELLRKEWGSSDAFDIDFERLELLPLLGAFVAE